MDEPTQQSTAPPPEQLYDPDIVCTLICTTNEQSKVLELRQKTPDQKEWAFGRHPDNEFPLGDSKRLSNKHFIIWMSDDNNSLLIRDTSTNGTFLNGSRLTKGKGYLLIAGDEIAIGIGIPEDVVRFVVAKSQGTKNNPPSIQGINAYYDIRDEILGSGAFAVVKKGVERSTGTTYAIKMIAKRKVVTGMAVKREIDILKQLNHPHVVGLKDFYEDDNYYYLVMEYITGGDLMDFVVNHGAIPEDTCREIIRQVVSAVDYVHHMGISHRDIKPDNILIAQDTPVVIKVSDFGLAKVSASNTFLKTFCGTLAYLAPEVLSSKRGNSFIYNNLVDIWSIGCLTYVILTGYMPFEGSTQEQLYKNVHSGSFLIEPLKACGVSDEGIKFLSLLLQVDPKKRPSASEALQLKWLQEDSDDGQARSQMGDDEIKSSAAAAIADAEVAAENVAQNLSDEAAARNVTLTPRAVVTPVQSDHVMAELEHDLSSDSELDSQEIRDAGKMQCSQWIASSIITSQHERSSPIQVAPYFSGIRDLDSPQHESDLPPGTWMTLATLPVSIPFKDIFITQKKFTIGRMPENDAAISENRISKYHCSILRVPDKDSGLDQVWLYDNSSNGCFVNGTKVGKNNKMLLQDGDQLSLFIDQVKGRRKVIMGFDVVFFDKESMLKRIGATMSPIPAERTAMLNIVDSISSPSPLNNKDTSVSTKRAFRALKLSTSSQDNSRPAKKVSIYVKPSSNGLVAAKQD